MLGQLMDTVAMDVGVVARIDRSKRADSHHIGVHSMGGAVARQARASVE